MDLANTSLGVDILHSLCVWKIYRGDLYCTDMATVEKKLFSEQFEAVLEFESYTNYNATVKRNVQTKKGIMQSTFPVTVGRFLLDSHF